MIGRKGERDIIPRSLRSDISSRRRAPITGEGRERGRERDYYAHCGVR